jgi:LysM repeat protein
VFTHLVQQGETTYSLSKKYCSDINDIRSLNALTQDYKINVGQSLMVPRTRC